MASRAELRQIAKELKIDSENKTIEQMSNEIKEKFDNIYESSYKLGADIFSSTLLKFISTEYDYVFFDKNKNELDYKFNKINKIFRKAGRKPKKRRKSKKEQ